MANIASFTSRYSPHNILAILGVLIFVAGTISAILLIIKEKTLRCFIYKTATRTGSIHGLG